MNKTQSTSTSEHLDSTIGKYDWMRENENRIKDLFPDTWTHVDNLNILKLMFNFKLLGIDWRTEEEFQFVLHWIQKNQLILVDGPTIKQNPHKVFK